MAKQMEETQFLQKCDVIIENNGTVEELRNEIKKHLA
jgi:dephospho-CoA kinase